MFIEVNAHIPCYSHTELYRRAKKSCTKENCSQGLPNSYRATESVSLAKKNYEAVGKR